MEKIFFLSKGSNPIKVFMNILREHQLKDAPLKTPDSRFCDVIYQKVSYEFLRKIANICKILLNINQPKIQKSYENFTLLNLRVPPYT